jgi:NAD+ kinase
MRIAIYGRSVNENYLTQIQELFCKLEAMNVQLYIHDVFYKILAGKIKLKSNINIYSSHSDISEKVNFMLSIGGDGTMLNTIGYLKNSAIPVIGINTGKLGFLSSIPTDKIDVAINALMNGEYAIEERSVLKLETANNLFGELNYALNDITIHKKDSSMMIIIHAYINGNFLNSYWADGLIISTPTGSTAYSLSCGGPIVMPNSKNLIITPIAPHNLNVRPLVIPDDSKITLRIEGRTSNYVVSLDSRSHNLDPEMDLNISIHDFKINLIRLGQENFFDTIRNKLMWGLDKRN